MPNDPIYDEIDDFVPSPSSNNDRQNARRRQRTFEPSEELSDEPLTVDSQDRENSKPSKTRKRDRDKKDAKPEENKKNVSLGINFKSVFADGRLRIFSGIFLIILALLITIVTISHLRNGHLDQSEVINKSLVAASQDPDIFKNMASAIGAWFTHIFFTRGLGISSFVVAIYCALLGLGLLHIKRTNFWGLTFKCLLLTVSVSILAGLFSYAWGSPIHWGGDHGHYVNKFLIDNGGWMLAVSVSVILITAVACVYLNELRLGINKAREQIALRKAKRELLREQKELNNIEDIEPETTDKEDDTTTAQTEATPISFDNAAPHEALSTYDPFDAIVNEGNDKIADAPVDSTSNEGFSIDDDQTEDDPFNNPAEDNKKPVQENDKTFRITANEIEQAQATNTQPQNVQPYDHRAELSRFRAPTIDLLEDRPTGVSVDIEEQQSNKEMIVRTLNSYDIPISRIEATIGPTVTLYEIVPGDGVRIARIKNLEDDIALKLAALGIRIIAPIPGKGTIGIEVPNRDPKIVSMRSILSSKKFQECDMALPMALGATISNDIFIEDLSKMPHLLVAGATGMGKSVGLNAIIASLLYKKHPSELKFVFIDPKRVEFSVYSKIEKFYLAKLPDEEDAIITEADKAQTTLNSLCVEMENRYNLMRLAGVRNLEEYNKKFERKVLSPEKGHRYLPYIVTIIDEFADIFTAKGKDVEQPVQRIAAMGRAAGMHIIMATQRPSTDVITGVIKANFPGRIAFRTIAMVDSKTILDRSGANQLIGRGDMLFMHNAKFERVQCAYISTEEVEALCNHIDNQVGYESAYPLPEFIPETSGNNGAMAGASIDKDPLFDEAARYVVSQTQTSTSSLQVRYAIGYNRASRIMASLEAAGIVGAAQGQKPRNVLVDAITLEHILENS